MLGDSRLLGHLQAYCETDRNFLIKYDNIMGLEYVYHEIYAIW